MHRLWEEQQQQHIIHKHSHAKAILGDFAFMYFDKFVHWANWHWIGVFVWSNDWLADPFIHLVSAKLSRNTISNYHRGSNVAERVWWHALSFYLPLVSDTISCLWNLLQSQHRVSHFTFITFPSHWNLYEIVRYCISCSTSILLDLELMNPGWKTCCEFLKSLFQIFENMKSCLHLLYLPIHLKHHFHLKLQQTKLWVKSKVESTRF